VKNFVLILALSFSTSSFCGIRSTILKKDTFTYPEPSFTENEQPVALWATNYHVAEYEDGSGDVAIRNPKGEEMGPKLSLEQWCKGALEGTIRIISKEGGTKTYNYHSENELFAQDCTQFFPMPVGKTKFRMAVGPFGDGTRGYRLIPYRSIATDPKFIPSGSVVYIPEARGAAIVLPNGETFVHDGFFMAADAGGAIKSNHIDVFTGSEKKVTNFPWITHTNAITFKAYIVKDYFLAKEMQTRHLKFE
jgi:3D (Asp-Asp-Asp) domain-containing protein